MEALYGYLRTSFIMIFINLRLIGEKDLRLMHHIIAHIVSQEKFPAIYCGYISVICFFLSVCHRRELIEKTFEWCKTGHGFFSHG